VILLNLPFLTKKDNKVVFTGEKLEIYIPAEYFENDLAEELGLKISTIGIFPMMYYSSLEGTRHTTYQFKLPETIVFSYTESRKEKVSIKEGYDEDNYTIYTLYNNDDLIENITMTKSFTNTEGLVKLHNTGRIPSTIKYSDILNLYLENMNTNDCNLGVPSTIIEAVISELARDKDNYEIPFRKAINSNPKLTELDYRQLSIKDLAMVTSTFTAITSENMNVAITSSVNKARNGGVENDTPVEKTIKY
jgi:hypothetical protein